MGQKINPTGFRLPVTRNWTSRWYAVGRDFSRTLGEDLAVRSFLLKKLRNASVSRILIERPANNARITIFSARPGIVIGKQGADIEALMALLTHGTGPLLTPTGLKHVAASGRAAQGERQQTGRGENENDGDHEYEVHHRPAPIDRAREASRRTARSTMPTARRRNGSSRPKQATASTTNSRITNSTTHHPRSPKDA